MKISFRSTKVGLNKKWSIPLLTLGLILILAPVSQAYPLGVPNPLVPAGNAFPLDATGTPAGMLLADMVSPYSFTTTAGTTSGTIESAVYREASGTLDFYYQVMNSSSSATSIARNSDTSFAGFLTDVYFRSDGSMLTGTSFTDGTPGKNPVLADRDATGSVVGFHFDLIDIQKIHPGETSAIMVISTNATNYMMGNTELLDGGSQTVAAFQPASGIPEPASMLLIGGGLLALAGLRRFRS